MNPEFYKSQVDKLKENGFTEELVLFKHPEGAYSVLTQMRAGDQFVEDMVEAVAIIVASLCKAGAKPGCEKAFRTALLMDVVRRLDVVQPVFTVGMRPTVEPDLQSYFKDPEEDSDQDQPGGE